MQDTADPPTELMYLCGAVRNALTFTNLQFCLSQKGIAIVDSPGIREEKSMDEMVTQYLTQAFAFVYVIDTSNSGGVNKYRVGIEITLSFLKLLFF